MSASPHPISKGLPGRHLGEQVVGGELHRVRSVGVHRPDLGRLRFEVAVGIQEMGEQELRPVGRPRRVVEELAGLGGDHLDPAGGRWGVGSDVDLVVIVASSDERPERRSLAFDASELPVPADILVYTVDEWDRLTEAGRAPIGPIEWLDP